MEVNTNYRTENGADVLKSPNEQVFGDMNVTGNEDSGKNVAAY
jgi:hypothetical protein